MNFCVINLLVTHRLLLKRFLPYEETREVYKHLWQALKSGGILYASYQYGSTHRF
jgi:hypothetical protein